MRHRLFAIGSVVLASALGTSGTIHAQTPGSAGYSYPYRATAPSSYRGPDVSLPQSSLSPNTVSNAAHSRPRHDPDHSYYSDNLGAGIEGSRLPRFLKNADARLNGGEEGGRDNLARIRLRVPAEARVWVDGVRTRQTGESRQFFSPPLTPGKKYSYKVRVRWMKDGEPVQQERRIAVRAGAQVQVDFTRPQTDKKAAKAEARK